jgi:hypothetical protein
MNKLKRILILGAVAAAVAVPTNAQTQPQGSDQAAQTQTDDAAKNKLYEDFLAARKKWKDSATGPTGTENYKAAYDLAKQYVDKYGAADDDYAKYVKKFVADYDTYQKASRRAQLETLVKDKKYPEAFTLGKQLLTENPDDLATLYLLSFAAINSTTTGDSKYDAEATAYAKKSLQLMEQGKTFVEGTPIPQKDEKLAVLNYGLGLFTASNPSESAGYLLKSAQINSPLKSNANIYVALAQNYEKEYEGLAKDYADKYKDATAAETPEGKAAKDKVDAVTDRLIDAYARAVAYAGNDAKPAWKDRLTELYKYRHEGSDAGLQEYISSITSKPLPAVTASQPQDTTSSAQNPSMSN